MSRDAPYPAIKQVQGMALALLDTTMQQHVLRSSEGRFSREEGRWLADTLASHAGPRLLLMHHPPFATGIDPLYIQRHLPAPVASAVRALGVDVGRWVSPELEDLAGVESFLREAPVDAVLCGHVHWMGERPFEREVGGVPVSCMGRSGGTEHEGREVYAYHLVDVGSSVQVRTVLVGEDELTHLEG